MIIIIQIRRRRRRRRNLCIFMSGCVSRRMRRKKKIRSILNSTVKSCCQKPSLPSPQLPPPIYRSFSNKMQSSHTTDALFPALISNSFIKGLYSKRIDKYRVELIWKKCKTANLLNCFHTAEQVCFAHLCLITFWALEHLLKEKKCFWKLFIFL